MIFLISAIFLWHRIAQFTIRIPRVDYNIPNLIADSIRTELSESMNLGFSAFELQEAKRQEAALKDQFDLTAVLLHWQRLTGLQNTLQYLLQSKLFVEIILWNNNPGINLTHSHLTNTNRSIKTLRIINSRENLKDEAKYRACAEAKTRACFYVDDDWNTAHYLKSVIASFRSDPTVLHAVTDEYTSYTNLVWSYIDRTIDLHTGFSWIGCGSVFLRQHAEQHLRFLRTFFGQNQSKTLVKRCAMTSSLFRSADSIRGCLLLDLAQRISNAASNYSRSAVLGRGHSLSVVFVYVAIRSAAIHERGDGDPNSRSIYSLSFIEQQQRGDIFSHADASLSTV